MTTRLADLHQPAPTSVQSTATLRQAAEVLTRNDIGVALVRVADRLAGIVSERDITRALGDGEDPDDARVEDVMAMELVSLGPEATAEEAAKLMLAGGIRHLPVVDDGKVIGMVSMRDVMALDHGAIN